MDELTVKIQRELVDAEIPAYGYPGDAGMDLAIVNEWTLGVDESRDLPTGIKVELPDGVWARITGRSSTLRKRGLFVNEGVIDQGYRGELFVYVTNRSGEPVTIEHGTRLAQLILAPVLRAKIVEVEQVADSHRGAKGFGSTGHREWTRVDAILEEAAHQAHGNGQEAWDSATIPPRDPEAKENTTEALGEAHEPVRKMHGSVYLGGPIDYKAGNPEDRHRRLLLACQMYGGGQGARPFFDIYCPSCRKRADESPRDAIIRNNSENRARDWGVFEYDAHGDVSFGTPVEIWERWQQGSPIIVVGSLGDGLFGQMLRQGGVLEVESMQRAVQMIVDGPDA